MTYPFHPHPILSQALALRSNVTPAGGVEVVLQNHEILGIRASPPEGAKVEEERRHQAGPSRRPQGLPGRGATGSPSQIGRGVQGLAAGLFDRAQAAGLDRTLMNTVADLRVC